VSTAADLERILDARWSDLEAALKVTSSLDELARIRASYVGREGILRALFQSLSQYPAEERPTAGQLLNAAKSRWTELLEQHQRALAAQGRVAVPSLLDRTLPGHPPLIGHRHPLTQVIDEILGIFERLGFTVVEGQEIETPFYNFDALNIPADHPARETFDTFFLNSAGPDAYLLRSHTSPMQVRYLQAHSPPFRIVVPGRVFRPDAVDASHCFQFHQIEGLVVEPEVTLADLKGVLTAVARAVFGPTVRMRFRPHFFPFTEPSAEVDISCIFCRGHGCPVCRQRGWLEILGAGMVHPHVFAAADRPPTTRGLAFGLGIERIAMLKYGIDDIRLFFENDVRFLHQF